VPEQVRGTLTFMPRRTYAQVEYLINLVQICSVAISKQLRTFPKEKLRQKILQKKA
jgi:hypothetical protein